MFGLPRAPSLVFAATGFGVPGRGCLCLLVGGLRGRGPRLSAGLSATLAFIGVKLIAEALLESGVHQIGPVPAPHIGTGLSLAIIGAVIITVSVTSLPATSRRQGQGRGGCWPCCATRPGTAMPRRPGLMR